MNKPNSVNEALERISNMELSVVRNFLINRNGYDQVQVLEMEKEYLRFMAICSVHATKKDPLPISSAVDSFWHAHILHTEEYMHMAHILGSKYIHHKPASGDELLALEPAYNKTLFIYEQNFGKPDQNYWPAFAQICGGSGCSCSGTGNE